MTEERKKLAVPDLREAKKSGRKLALASIPDYPSAVWAERAGLDMLGKVSNGSIRWLFGITPSGPWSMPQL